MASLGPAFGIGFSSSGSCLRVAKHDSLHRATSQLLCIVFCEFEKWHFSFVEQTPTCARPLPNCGNGCRHSADREGHGALGGAALRHLTQPFRYFVIGLSPVPRSI